MTSELCLIGLRSGDLDGQGMSLQKAQSHGCDMRSRTLLHQALTPVMSKSIGLSRHTYWPANTNHAILIKYIKNTRKATFYIEEAWSRKNDLFDDDLYLLCVISIFATFEIGGYLRS